MAVKQPVWGIDVGQCALKALKLRATPEGELEAVSFDYIEHSKILSQPDANPAEEIHKALETFLSRNDVKGDQVAISVPGQAALARFIQLPPVETKKIPEIVRYEARQQIPFDLSEVIWDFQTIGEGEVEEGFAVGAEIGLFAIRREVVQELISNFQGVGLEVEVVQTLPLALYNFALADMDLGDDAVVLLDIGADNTNLVIADATRIWQRNIPIGGNTFTKTLIRDFKLTFAKAEHLKRNATKSKDARRIFQSMRPVFNDLVGEIQRSLGYYTSLNREGSVRSVVALGNAFKLPGLLRYLNQNLSVEVVKPTEFAALAGSTTLAAPIFQENLTSFAGCYGLALQGLDQSRIYTNLILPEITQERIIRRKKPWALTAAASLMLGFTMLFIGAQQDHKKVSAGENKKAINDADKLIKRQQERKGRFGSARGQLNSTIKKGDVLTAVVDLRDWWPNVLRTINQGLPKVLQRTDLGPKDREEVTVSQLGTTFVRDLSNWWVDVVTKSRSSAGSTAGRGGGGEGGFRGGAEMGAGPDAGFGGPDMGGGSPDRSAQLSETDRAMSPKGEGWAFRLEGFTYHKDEGDFVQNKVIAGLRKALERIGGRNVLLVEFAPTEEELSTQASTDGSRGRARYNRRNTLRNISRNRLAGFRRGEGGEAPMDDAGAMGEPGMDPGRAMAGPEALGAGGLGGERRKTQRVTRTDFVIVWCMPVGEEGR